MKVWERIESLRKRMREEDIDVYYIPTNDFHGSEYVSGYFQTREYISGFTGSAGVVIVTLEDAGLWTETSHVGDGDCSDNCCRRIQHTDIGKTGYSEAERGNDGSDYIVTTGRT